MRCYLVQRSFELWVIPPEYQPEFQCVKVDKISFSIYQIKFNNIEFLTLKNLKILYQVLYETVKLWICCIEHCYNNSLFFTSLHGTLYIKSFNIIRSDHCAINYQDLNSLGLISNSNNSLKYFFLYVATVKKKTVFVSVLAVNYIVVM